MAASRKGESRKRANTLSNTIRIASDSSWVLQYFSVHDGVATCGVCSSTLNSDSYDVLRKHLLEDDGLEWLFRHYERRRRENSDEFTFHCRICSHDEGASRSKRAKVNFEEEFRLGDLAPMESSTVEALKMHLLQCGEGCHGDVMEQWALQHYSLLPTTTPPSLLEPDWEEQAAGAPFRAYCNYCREEFKDVKLGGLSELVTHQLSAKDDAHERHFSKPQRLRLRYLHKSLSDQRERLSLKCDLIPYCIFMIIFITFQIARNHTEDLYWLSSQVGGTIEGNQFSTREAAWSPLASGEVAGYRTSRDFTTVTTTQDYMQWAKTVMLPSVWDVSISSSENRTDPYVSRFIVGNNKPLGALQVRLLRTVGSGGCSLNTGVLRSQEAQSVSYLSRGCFPTYSDAVVNKSAFPLQAGTVDRRANITTMPYHECDIPLNVEHGIFATYPCGGNLFHIPFSLSLDDAIAEFNRVPLDMLDLRLIAVEFFVYNSAIDRFSYFYSTAEVSLGGGLYTYAKSHSFPVWTSSHTGSTVFFVVFVITILIVFGYRIAVDLYESFIGRTLLEKVVSGWFWLDVINFCIFICSIIVHIVWMQYSSSLGVKVWFPQLSDRDIFPTALSRLTFYHSLEEYFVITNTILSFVKAIKYTKLNSSMAVVINTLARARDSMLSILLLFALVVFAYAIAGTILFGHAIPDRFDQLGNSFTSLLRLLVGDFDYDAMRNASESVAGLYFWSYVILALYIMMSLFIGALASAFEDALNERAEKSALRRKCADDKMLREARKAIEDETETQIDEIKKKNSHKRRTPDIKCAPQSADQPSVGSPQPSPQLSPQTSAQMVAPLQNVDEDEDEAITAQHEGDLRKREVTLGEFKIMVLFTDDVFFSLLQRKRLGADHPPPPEKAHDPTLMTAVWPSTTDSDAWPPTKGCNMTYLRHLVTCIIPFEWLADRRLALMSSAARRALKYLAVGSGIAGGAKQGGVVKKCQNGPISDIDSIRVMDIVSFNEAIEASWDYAYNYRLYDPTYKQEKEEEYATERRTRELQEVLREVFGLRHARGGDHTDESYWREEAKFASLWSQVDSSLLGTTHALRDSPHPREALSKLYRPTENPLNAEVLRRVKDTLVPGRVVMRRCRELSEKVEVLETLAAEALLPRPL